MIQLYYAPPSIYGRKALTVLMEKGLDYEIKKMSFATKDHLKEDYLRLNPNGEIPTIVDDGQIIYESTAIIEYLDEEYPEPPLMPKDSYLRARVRMIDGYCDLHLYRHIVHCLLKKYIKNEELTDEDRKPIVEDLKRIEFYLGDQKFLVGEFSLADCAFMPAIVSFDPYGVQSAVNSSPKLKAYIDRLKLRPSYKGASLVKLE